MPRQKLTQRKDGRYACKYDGKFFYGKSTTEALRKRDEYIKEKEAGFNPELADTRFLEYGLKWRQVYRSGCNKKLQKDYDHYITVASGFLNNPPIRSITAMDIQRLFNSTEGYSKDYISRFSSLVKGILKSAIADGIILRNPSETARTPSGTYTGHRALEPWERKLVTSTWEGHPFGLCAMTMMYTGLRIGEALYLDIDRDVDFINKTVTVRGSLSYSEGNKPIISAGKTKAAKRIIPLVDCLSKALSGHHGLLCGTSDGEYMTFHKYYYLVESYVAYLEEHSERKPIVIKCHDFRVTYCTLCYEAGIPIKTLQSWMGHSDSAMIMKVYAKLTSEKEQSDREKINDFFNSFGSND